MPLAILRPDDWDFPLFLHVLGAMLLVGSLVLVVTTLAVAWRRPDAGEAAVLTRVGFRSLLFGVIPAYLLMRIPGQWIASEENLDENEPGWVGVGYVTSDIGLVVMLVATILAGLAVRQSRRTGGGGSTLARIAAVLAGVLLAAYLVAVWAMTTKPT